MDAGTTAASPIRNLPMLARILCAADICDALSASRPYREGMPTERVLEIMGREVGTAIDPDCFAALESVAADGSRPRAQRQHPRCPIGRRPRRGLRPGSLTSDH